MTPELDHTRPTSIAKLLRPFVALVVLGAVCLVAAPAGAAIFYTFQATNGPGGTIAPKGNNLKVQAGTSITFTITPSAGFQIDNVLVDNVSVGPVATYTFAAVSAGHTIHATFAANTPPAVTVTAPNGGEQLLVGTRTMLQWSATDNVGVTSVDLLLSRTGASGAYATIASGLSNSGAYQWVVSGPGTAQAILKVVAHDAGGLTGQDVSNATFTIGEWTILATAGGGGSISPSGATIVVAGASRTFTITPNANHYIFDVAVDGSSVGPVSTYTFNGVNADHTIAATFAAGPYTLSVTTVGLGVVAKDPDLAGYPGGSTVVLTATPFPGMAFMGWSGDTTTAANPITLPMYANRQITATFQPPVLRETSTYFPPYNGSLPPSWADYDLDGLMDLTLYHNNSDGNFDEIPGMRALLENGNYHGAAWCDYDHDGDPDLVLLPYEGAEINNRAPSGDSTRVSSTQNTGAIHLFRNDRALGFVDVAPALGIAREGFGETAVWLDVDADGRPDLFAPFYSHLPPYQSFLFHNNGNGTFKDQAILRGVGLENLPAEFKPEGACAVDIDNDGDIDLYCASHLFINDGNGYFIDQRAAAGLPMIFDEGAVFVDYDNDGDFDLNLRTADGPKLYRNDGGHFTDVTAQSGLPQLPLDWGDSWADVDNDGDLDVYLMVPNFQPGWLMLNQGNGAFLRDTTVMLSDGSGLSSWADYDRDGDLDLNIEAYNRHLFENTRDQRPGFDGSWVRVDVQDPNGRRTMVGATVRLKRLDGTPNVQTRAVDGGSGYLTQSEYIVHFGADPNGRYALEVSFPSRPGNHVVVDSTEVPWLGSIVPSALQNQIIIVRHDGNAYLSASLPTLAVPPVGTPLTRILAPPAPNPARGPTRMRFHLAIQSDVAMVIHDVAGRVVRRVALGRLDPGDQQWTWDGRDDRGRRVPSGVYLSRLMIGGRKVAEQRVVQLD